MILVFARAHRSPSLDKAKVFIFFVAGRQLAHGSGEVLRYREAFEYRQVQLVAGAAAVAHALVLVEHVVQLGGLFVHLLELWGSTSNMGTLHMTTRGGWGLGGLGLALIILGGVCRPVLKTLILLQTKIYDLPYPIFGLTPQMLFRPGKVG